MIVDLTKQREGQLLSGEPGQTLVEILVAITVVALVVVALVSRVVDAVGSANFARNQVLATRFSQEGIEWTRAQRDRLGWARYQTEILLDGDPVTYCLTDLSVNPQLELISPGLCAAAGTIPGTIFLREIEIDYVDAPDPNGDYTDVTSTVSWTDRIGTHSSVLRTRFSDWSK